MSDRCTNRVLRLLAVTFVVGCSTPIANPGVWNITSHSDGAVLTPGISITVAGNGPANTTNTIQIGLNGNLPYHEHTFITNGMGQWSATVPVPTNTGEGYLSVGEFHLGPGGIIEGQDADVVDIVIQL
jgi:hypothetical protein